ncbi:MAG: MCE family protein, partial [Magnetococcales bacterium]|nr:MCE family protein [Magnetococcales bacterium]
TLPPLPEPRIGRRRLATLSPIWLVPLIAALVASWIAWRTLAEQGPTISITFKSAEGIAAGKTRIKHKEVDIGLVTAVKVDVGSLYSRVTITAEMSRAVEDHLTEGTRFWVVRPRLSLKEVSGLSTLVSGTYIEMEPGSGPEHHTFTGMDTPPVIRADQAGARFLLTTESLGSLTQGAPVYYRDIPVGEVMGYNLTDDKQGVSVHIFVQAPHHLMVHKESRFWQVGGVDLSLTAEGFAVHTNSLQKLVQGGVAFETPEAANGEPPAADGASFRLFPDRKSIDEGSYTRKIPYVLFFDGSVRGLKTGAPVEFRGIRIGSVTDIRMEYDSVNGTFRIPVLVQIEPERVTEIKHLDEAPEESPYSLLDQLVAKGLRARLQMGSILTGQLFVELDLHPEAPRVHLGKKGPIPELPTIGTPLDEITSSVNDFLKRLRALPLESIGKELEATVAGANKTINSPEVLQTVIALKESLLSLQKALNRLDTETLPATSTSLRETSEAAREAMIQAQQTLKSVEGAIRPDSPLHYGLVEATNELAASARAIRALVEALERQPESLLFGKGATVDPGRSPP